MNDQVVSRQRVTDHGEVYTGQREVQAMLDLVEIQRRKLRVVRKYPLTHFQEVSDAEEGAA